jgi:hypothetical protein
VNNRICKFPARRRGEETRGLNQVALTVIVVSALADCLQAVASHMLFILISTLDKLYISRRSLFEKAHLSRIYREVSLPSHRHRSNQDPRGSLNKYKEPKEISFEMEIIGWRCIKAESTTYLKRHKLSICSPPLMRYRRTLQTGHCKCKTESSPDDANSPVQMQKKRKTWIVQQNPIV